MRRRARRRGFTLVELMVSLLAGVIVSMAVIGLAKTSTNAFHEEVRGALVEASLRTAAERLRSDLTRVSFMSTGNITVDPTIAKPPGATTGSRYTDLNNLAGLRTYMKGSPAQAVAIENSINGLNPDAIEIGGNLTTDDSYRGQWIISPTSPAASCANATRLVLNRAADSAVERLLSGATSTADVNAIMQNAFVPVAGSTFAARVQDARGCFHFVEVCGAGGIDASGQTAFVDFQPDSSSRTILTPTDTGNDNCGGREMEEFSVSPVHRVKWMIKANPNAADTRLDPDLAAELAPKFNLYRALLDATDAEAVPTKPELVAEYAVDFKVGIVFVDPATNATTVKDIDTDAVDAVIQTTTDKVSGISAGSIGPQNVKAVRFRLSLRTPLPDRTANIIVAPAPYISRYCSDPGAASVAACKRFARVRSIVSEVALLNQGRMFYK